MSRCGINITEEAHVVNILPPRNLTAAKTSDVVSLKKYSHATVIFQRGATFGGTVALKVKECDDVTPTTPVAIKFRYALENTPYATGDAPAVLTWTTATTGITLAASINSYVIIEVDAEELSDGYPFFYLTTGAASAGVAYGSAVAVLSGARYAKSITPSAIS
jgi:hypothetical protein